MLDISDIKCINIEKNNHQLDYEDENDRQNFKDSENTIIIKLKKNAFAKIKELKQNKNVLIRLTICKRTFILSLPFNKIKNGIYIKDNISYTYAEELRLTYPSFFQNK